MILLFLLFPVITQALNLNYIVQLNKDGTGRLTLMYWEKKSEIAAKNSMIGNFPFSSNRSDLAEKFTAPGISILSSELKDYSQDNSFSQNQLVLQFNDITKLGSLGALSGMDVNTFATDTGKILSFAVTPGFVTKNSLNALYVILNYEGEILFASDKKIIDKKRAEWFRGSQFIKSDKNIYFVALLESVAGVKPNEKKKDEGGDKSSCGLFGFELPLVLLLGFSYGVIAKRSRANSKSAS